MNLYAYRKMIVTIAGTLVVCVGLELLVFGKLRREWNETESELTRYIEEFRAKTFNLPLDINNVERVNRIIGDHEKVISAQMEALNTIDQQQLPIFAPPQETAAGAMVGTILERLRRIAETESDSGDTTIRILESLGIGIDRVPGRTGGFAYRASPQGVRTYLALRPTQPNRPRIDGVSGVVEFWFRPTWQPSDQTRDTRILFLAQSTPKVVNPRAVNPRDRYLVDQMIRIDVVGGVLRGIMKPAGFDARSHEVSIAQWRPFEWHHIALSYDEGIMRFFLDGNEAQPTSRRGATVDLGSRPGAVEMPGAGGPTGAVEDRRRFYEEMMRSRIGGMAPTTAAPRAAAPRTAAAKSGGPPPERFRLQDLTQICVGGMPDLSDNPTVPFTEAASAPFDDLRILRGSAFAFEERYDGRDPRVLFYEDFEDELIAIEDIPDALNQAEALRNLLYANTINVDTGIRRETAEELQIVRSMLGGVSERETMVATEFSSYPKRLYATDLVARAVNDDATSVFQKLDFTRPEASIVRELYLYLVVGKDLAEHAMDADLGILRSYRYLGGSRELTDEGLRSWIKRRLTQLSTRTTAMTEEARLQRAIQLNLPMDARSAQAETEKLEQALESKFPPHWVRVAYETDESAQGKKDPNYRRLLLELVLEGDIVSITKFVHLLEQKTHLVTVQEMDLKQEGTGNRNLRVVLRSEAHFFEPPKDYFGGAGKGAAENAAPSEQQPATAPEAVSRSEGAADETTKG